MLRRILGSHGLLSLVVIVVVAAAAVIGSQILHPAPEMRGYCAEMPDAIGLYVGSAVTVMGLPVGRVTGIQPHGPTARVEFELPAARKLPADVGATTLSDTLVADRRLAVIGDQAIGGASWNPGQCITKTLTPKSLSETFSALADLSDQLNGANDPQHPELVGKGLTALDTMSTGTGTQINSILQRLGTALNAPDAAIGHIGGLIDAVSSLARSAAAYWPQVEDMLTRLAQVLDTMNNTAIPPVLTFMEKLSDILPALNDITVTMGGPLLRRLDAVENLPQLLQAGVSGLRAIVAMIPSISGAFTDAIDPDTKSLSLAYTAPRVAIPDSDAAQVCSALNMITAGTCADAGNGLVDIPLAHVVLGSVRAR